MQSPEYCCLKNCQLFSSVFAVRGVPERCRTLTSKSSTLKRQNRYLQVLWERTPSMSTGHIDWHASAAFFPCWIS
uniref:Secreted protein n=1 Tax=Heterorhabditis bacteriophora TaxID=37862 RepID=A0A1I7WYT9_HETBA